MLSQRGRPTSGYRIPDRNISGIRIICIRPIIACICLIRAATTSPNAVMVKPSSNISTARVASITGEYGTSTNPASASTIRP